MLDGSAITEIEFKEFMQAGFEDHYKLDPRQITEIKRINYRNMV